MALFKSERGPCYEYRFKTTFEETNVVGNIYFANYALWQGKCREMFLYDYCRDILQDINDGLALITTDLSLQFISQLFAFDEVVIRMTLGAHSQSRLMMEFEYFREHEDQLTLVCRGHQATVAMRKSGDRMVAVPFPQPLLDTLEAYS
jgi:enediyne core biosynthesis thioesterase